MRLSRTDFVPALTIVAGGLIGASLSFSFLGSRSDDVPGVTLGLLYESSATPELAIRVEHPDGPVVTSASIEYNGMVFTPVVVPSAPSDGLDPTVQILVGGEVAAESVRDPLRVRFLEEYRRLALDRMEQVKTDVEKLQEEGWDVTFRLPVFRLLEIQSTRER